MATTEHNRKQGEQREEKETDLVLNFKLNKPPREVHTTLETDV